MKIRIGHLSTFYHTAVVLMAQGRASARLGAEVEWRLFGTGPAIMQAFQQGELDLAYIGLPPAMIGMARGIDVVCVAGGHMEGTVMAGKSRWLGHADTRDPVRVLEQFRGLKIGVPGRGSIHDVILRDQVQRAGQADAIAIVNYAWADLVTEAVVHDEVAAAFGTPALAVAIERFARGKVLIPPSQLWPDNPSYGIVAHRKFLQQAEAAVEGFLALHEEAAAFIRTDPAGAARVIAGFVSVVDPEFVLDTLSLSPRYCAKLTGEFIASTMKFVPILQERGFMSGDLSRDRIFFPSIMDRIHPEPGHYNDGIRTKEL